MKIILACLLQFSALILFLGSCWIAASDAQGGIVFILALPLAAALLAGSSVLAGRGNWLRYLAYGLLSYLALFFLGAFLPFVSLVNSATMDAVVFVSRKVTGQTPYQATHAKHDVRKMLEAELERTGKSEIDFANIRTGWDWHRVCIFGPYTTNTAAAETLGFKGWDMEKYSQIAVSDSVQIFAFVDSKEGVVRYSAELTRAQGDFAALGGKCFGKEKVAAPGPASASPSSRQGGP